MSDLFSLDLTHGRQVWQADALELTKRMPPESIHLTVTDPAYSSLEKHRSRGTTTRLVTSWFDVVSYDYLGAWLHALYQAHAPRSHAYVFGDEATIEMMKVYARRAGWWVWKSLVWVKSKTNGVEAEKATEEDVRIGTGYHWRASNERILFLEKRTRLQSRLFDPEALPTGRGRQLNNRSWPDVLLARPVRGGYPTAKPAGLVGKLVVNSSNPGELVFDPFAGSGVVAKAASYHDRRFMLGEKRHRTDVEEGAPVPLGNVPWEGTQYEVLDG